MDLCGSRYIRDILLRKSKYRCRLILAQPGMHALPSAPAFRPLANVRFFFFLFLFPACYYQHDLTFRRVLFIIFRQTA